MKEKLKKLTHKEQKVLYMKKEDFQQLTANELKRIIITAETIPAQKRFAAVRLYNLGEKDYGIEFLINQMNLYKDPSTHKNIRFETCPAAAKELGKLKDKRAIEPLFEALGELAYGPAYGLAKMNSSDIERRLLGIANLETKEGIYAVIALGFMKNKDIVPQLIYFLEHAIELEERIKDIWIGLLYSYTIKILGSYKDNIAAEEAFKKFINKNYIMSILNVYLVQNDNPTYRDIEWEIAKKYGWDNYIDNNAKKFAFSFRHISWWDSDYKCPCPFKSDIEVEKLRDEITERIWQKIKNN